MVRLGEPRGRDREGPPNPLNSAVDREYMNLKRIVAERNTRPFNPQ